MSTATDVPMPAGAVQVSAWTDVGAPDEYRTFHGPTPYADPPAPSDLYAEGQRAVTVFGTQLRDGTVEFRCVRVIGIEWDTELDSATARVVGRALIEAADSMEVNCGP